MITENLRNFNDEKEEPANKADDETKTFPAADSEVKNTNTTNKPSTSTQPENKEEQKKPQGVSTTMQQKGEVAKDASKIPVLSNSASGQV